MGRGFGRGFGRRFGRGFGRGYVVGLADNFKPRQKRKANYSTSIGINNAGVSGTGTGERERGRVPSRQHRDHKDNRCLIRPDRTLSPFSTPFPPEDHY